MLAHGSNPSANASGSGAEKQSVAAEAAALSSWLAGAPVPMSFFVLVRRRRRRSRHLSPAPPSAPGAAPFELGELPCGACWEAGWPSRADCHGRLAPFVAVAAALGRVHSLARWWRPWQRRQRRDNWQVATRYE